MEVTINGKGYEITCNPNTRLSSFIRNHARLKGTKVMCYEGGCGVCTVTVTRRHPVTGEHSTEAINSCLCPVYMVAGCHVTTVEGLGSEREGFHSLQKNIATYNGSQCGYCTPGMVMNMYGFFCNHTSASEAEVENSFDGVLCRCTGYRPILDSAKAFLNDKNSSQSIVDIEELCKFKCPTGDNIKEIVWKNRIWYFPQCLQELFQAYECNDGKQVELVFGNTSKGIYKETSESDVYIYLRSIRELYNFEVKKDEIIVGSNISMQKLIYNLQQSSLQPKFVYLQKSLIPQLMKTAGSAVRNASGWAGNLMLKHRDNSFLSDVFTPLEALQAKIHVSDKYAVKEYTPNEFLKVDMTRKVIVALTLPPVDTELERFQTFKVMPRAAQSKAHINASFYVQFEKRNKIINTIRIVFGGLGSTYVRANNIEHYLMGKTLSKEVFKEACVHLTQEPGIDESQLLTSKNYRISAARNLLYMFLKNACNPDIDYDQFIENTTYVRPVSRATCEFDENEQKYPYCQPMPKLDAILQASGEAEYTSDRSFTHGELQAVCVLSEFAKAKIEYIDDSKALATEGVHSVISSKNMFGHNCVESPYTIGPLNVLADGEVYYAGQPVAIVVADTLSAAIEGAKSVRVTYTDIQTPVLDLNQAIEASYTHPRHSKFTYDIIRGDVDDVLKLSERIIEGQVETESQYHFYMENNMCLVTPYDDMLDIHCTSQVLGAVQTIASGITGKSHAQINVKVLRLGGGFGGRGALSEFTTPALGVIASHTTRRSVRLHTTLEQCMKMNGKRYPMLMKYKVGTSGNGQIKAIAVDVYQDCGSQMTSLSQGLLERGIKVIDNAYRIPNWKITAHPMKSDKPMAMAMRGPDTLQVCFLIESLMEHVAYELGTDPVLFKEIHLIKNGDLCLRGEPYQDVIIQKVWSDLKESASIKNRLQDIEDFNQGHKFVKRGLGITPTRFQMRYAPACTYNVYVAVYASDGTVAITHGCVEMGQGLNTKVIQVASQCLGIDVNQIKVHTTSTLTSANNAGTFASQGSDNVCKSTLEACKLLKKKMEPYQNEDSTLSWKELVTKCNETGLDMTASYRHRQGTNHGGQYAYCIYSACAVEVEVNVLTGETTVRRLDGIFDVGESANPTVDVGQVEGAIVMGLGFFLSEKEIYDKDTGVLLTSGTWEYKPPSALDIPIEMNIKLLRNNYNELGVMPSKATGEPPILTSCAVMFAIKHAIQSYRSACNNKQYFTLNQPATVDVIQQLCNVTVEDLIAGLP